MTFVIAIALTIAAIVSVAGLLIFLSKHFAGPDRLRGHAIYWDSEQWRYSDTSEPTIANERDCGQCGLANTPEGHDGCLGTLPEVKNACCGHGDQSDAYIQFEDGRLVGGRDAVMLFELHGYRKRLTKEREL